MTEIKSNHLLYGLALGIVLGGAAMYLYQNNMIGSTGEEVPFTTQSVRTEEKNAAADNAEEEGVFSDYENRMERIDEILAEYEQEEADWLLQNPDLVDTRELFAGCTGVTQIPQKECLALKDLYDNTEGDSWKTKTGWLQSNSPCSWHGVSCGSGHVRVISLANNNLSGRLSPSLGDLQSIEIFNLGGNKLTGGIPREIGNLTKVWTMTLSNNELSGIVPATIGNLTKLQNLYLNNNNLLGALPVGFSTLTNLGWLHLHANQFTGPFPSWVKDLTRLTEFKIDNNLLCGTLPEDMHTWWLPRDIPNVLTLNDNHFITNPAVYSPEMQEWINENIVWGYQQSNECQKPTPPTRPTDENNPKN